jgi:hypothetical protein
VISDVMIIYRDGKWLLVTKFQIMLGGRRVAGKRLTFLLKTIELPEEIANILGDLDCSEEAAAGNVITRDDDLFVCPPSDCPLCGGHGGDAVPCVRCHTPARAE